MLHTPEAAASTPTRVTTIPQMLALLDDVHELAELEQWESICPAHDDANPSLRITWDQDAQKLLMHCWAGCTNDAVLGELGMSRRDIATIAQDEAGYDDLEMTLGRASRGRKASITRYRPISDSQQQALASMLARDAQRFQEPVKPAFPGQKVTDVAGYATTRYRLTMEQAKQLRLGVGSAWADGRTFPALRVPLTGVTYDADSSAPVIGGITGYQDRLLGDDVPKKDRWKTPTAFPDGSSPARCGALYLPTNAEDETGAIVVTEGPGDALTAVSLGYPAIALLGAQRATNAEVQAEVAHLVHWLAERRDIDDPWVVVAGDGDTAGEGFSRALGASLTGAGFTVYVLTPPAGSDFTEMREAGGEPVQEASVPWAEWVADHTAPTPAPKSVASSHRAATRAPQPDAFGARTLSLNPMDAHATDLGAARLMNTALAQLGTPARHCPDRGGWLIYDTTRGFWTRDASTRLRSVAHTVADHLDALAAEASSKAAAMGEEDPRKTKAERAVKHMRDVSLRFQSTRMISSMLTELESILAAHAEEFDGPETLDLKVVGNGVVNLRTGELTPWDAGLMMTSGVGIIYDPGAPCTAWEAFITRASVADVAEMPRYLQTLAGLMATGRTEQNVHFALGAGANGKGVWLNVMKSILGEDVVTTGSSTFEDSVRGEGATPMLASLEPARAVTVDELKARQVLDDGRIKALSGDSHITTRRLHAEPRSWLPRFTMVVATNHPPQFPTDAPDYGVRRRVRVLPFLMQLAPEEQNPRIVEELLEAESEGILAWVVRGAMRYYLDGLPAPAFVVKASEAMWVESNPLVDLMEGEGSPFAREDGAEVSRTDAYAAYSSWCGRTGQQAWSARRFYAALEGFGISSRASNGQRLLVGIRLSDAEVKRERAITY